MSEKTQTAPRPAEQASSSAAQAAPKFSIAVNRKLCKACGLCVRFCPAGNLAHRGRSIAVLAKCKGCRLCERYCPDMAIKVRKQDEPSTPSRQ